MWNVYSSFWSFGEIGLMLENGPIFMLDPQNKRNCIHFSLGFHWWFCWNLASGMQLKMCNSLKTFSHLRGSLSHSGGLGRLGLWVLHRPQSKSKSRALSDTFWFLLISKLCWCYFWLFQLSKPAGTKRRLLLTSVWNFLHNLLQSGSRRHLYFILFSL